ncbi:MAG TPA: hypothetical protein PLV92_21395, partial [Pirellulaceae bacterium]|nr:hypothetical protein [Pirellulaceae bacterium]
DAPKNAKVSFASGEATISIGGRRLTPSGVHSIWLRRPKPVHVESLDPAEASHARREWSEALDGVLALAGC